MAMTYFRLLWVVIRKPGYVERSAQYYAQRAEKKRIESEGGTFNEKNTQKSTSIAGPGYVSTNGTGSRSASDQRPSLEDFIKRDVFVCQGDGRPVWCTNCQNWKPDRTHHCREVDQCVRKMDHYCPWVGGIVSETSFKFFVQFVGWAGIFCIYVLILVAILLAEHKGQTGTVSAHWVVTVALSGLFGLFTVGMFGSSMQFVLLNTTTIENLSRKSVTYQLAIHLPQPPPAPLPFPVITFSTVPVPPGTQAPPEALKMFAILHTQPGDNPWDLGWRGNFKEVMGEHWYDWFLPFHYSPCTNHDRVESQFAVGPVVQRMRREAGISPSALEEKPRRRRKHRRRRSEKHADLESGREKTAHTGNGNGVTARYE